MSIKKVVLQNTKTTHHLGLLYYLTRVVILVSGSTSEKSILAVQEILQTKVYSLFRKHFRQKYNDCLGNTLDKSILIV